MKVELDPDEFMRICFWYASQKYRDDEDRKLFEKFRSALMQETDFDYADDLVRMVHKAVRGLD